MVTDGVDTYEIRYDPEDPYVQAAIEDAVRAHLIVYSIYWTNSGPLRSHRLRGRHRPEPAGTSHCRPRAATATGRATAIRSASSRTLLTSTGVSATSTNSTSWRRVGSKPQMRDLRLKLNVPAKVDAPQQVYVHAAARSNSDGITRRTAPTLITKRQRVPSLFDFICGKVRRPQHNGAIKQRFTRRSPTPST